MPVGDKPTYEKKENEEKQDIFPHVYGPLLKTAVIGTHVIRRDKSTGEFLSIGDLC
jgi:uncharacterized protein (DUF952 family)